MNSSPHIIDYCNVMIIDQETFFGMFFRFPNDPQRKKQWVVAMRRVGFQPTRHSTLCSDHFDEECFERFGERARLKKTAIPTIFNFPAHLQKVLNN